LTGKHEKNLVNFDHLKRAQERRQILHQYWQETERQAAQDTAQSISREAEQPTTTANSASDQTQDERAR
jgi:hypothetical protein